MNSDANSIFEIEGLGGWNIQSFVDEDREIWFNAKEVLQSLGLDRTAISRVPRSQRIDGVFPIKGSTAKATAISEYAFFRLIGSARHSRQVDAFEEHVYLILKCIRKHGYYIPGMEYMTEEQLKELDAQVETSKQYVAEMVAENQRLTRLNEKLESGKKKLSIYLAEEEDRNFAAHARIAELLAEIEALRTQVANLTDILLDYKRLTEYESRLRIYAEMETLSEQIRQKETAAAEANARIEKMVNENIERQNRYETNPMARDKYGIVARKSDILSTDRVA